MEQQPILKCGQCFQELKASESLEHKCPRLLDLLQSPIGPESKEEAEERKKEIRRREEARKEIELKNEFKRIQRKEKLKQEGWKPRDRKEKKIGEDILKIVEETRKKWEMRKYEEERQELEEKKKEEDWSVEKEQITKENKPQPK